MFTLIAARFAAIVVGFLGVVVCGLFLVICERRAALPRSPVEFES